MSNENRIRILEEKMRNIYGEVYELKGLRRTVEDLMLKSIPELKTPRPLSPKATTFDDLHYKCKMLAKELVELLEKELHANSDLLKTKEEKPIKCKKCGQILSKEHGGDGAGVSVNNLNDFYCYKCYYGKSKETFDKATQAEEYFAVVDEPTILTDKIPPKVREAFTKYTESLPHYGKPQAIDVAKEHFGVEQEIPNNKSRTIKGDGYKELHEDVKDIMHKAIDLEEPDNSDYKECRNCHHMDDAVKHVGTGYCNYRGEDIDLDGVCDEWLIRLNTRKN